MASLLRQIVAGPRARHPEAGLDLCYVTDNIIATSGPSQTYPQRAYRNPLDRLVDFLDSKHGKNWAIWEFRGEGTGYPDELVYNRIRHYPWPDHHPPPFRLVPMIVASMRNWLNGNDLEADADVSDGKKNIVGKVLDTWKDEKNGGRVVVVHCKAGKGRSGTMACSYLIAECGWTPEEALARFTERRMRPKFGAGVTIPSQLRWIGYVDRWAKGGRKYVDRELEIVEIHVWGLRSGVKLSVEGFVDGGRKIKVVHTFTKRERLIVEGNAPGDSGVMDMFYDMAGYGTNSAQGQEVLDEAKQTGQVQNAESTTISPKEPVLSPAKLKGKPSPKLITKIPQHSSTEPTEPTNSTLKTSENGSKQKSNNTSSSSSPLKDDDDSEPGGMAVIFKPQSPIILPNSDVNICIERRNRAPTSMGFTMVTAVAHVWFNTFFEGNGPEKDGSPDMNGVFQIEWDKMDGIKGSSQKGTRAADKIAVVWKSTAPDGGAKESTMPSIDSPVPQMPAADWKGENDEDPDNQKHLGLRVRSPDSTDVSQASSIKEETIDESKAKGKGIEDDVGASEYDMKREGSSALRDETGMKEGDVEKLQAYADKLPNPEGNEK
ncbi:phosphatases II [Annulohypoxylon maeteangense]|uniref:phosphatases II n=1 Tax=Annulohypoxylon maeteangense TaxID=1927788 RepID=UPI0020078614|nr:phosphatases II [Annulohypoxylon maeteangense]KAI0889169.1 phosphatases II [Annulohypoxylon maeteangense]